MSENDLNQADTCGCCDDGVPSRSQHANRPGLPAIDYRIGTQAGFLRRMLARIHAQTVPPDDTTGARPLLALTTRALEDPTVAVLDAWAVAADVLTFYQERIANENYLRTATERRSVLELARAIGYELKPGVAASAFLAFVVEDAPGAPETASVPQGVQVQSIPPQGKLPQTFETEAAIVAHKSWNALRPRLSRPQLLAIHDGALYLFAIDGSIAAPDATIAPAELYEVGQPVKPEYLPDPVPAVKVERIYVAGTDNNLKVGDLLLLVGRNGSDLKTFAQPIRGLALEPKLGRTRIDLAANVPLGAPKFHFTIPAYSVAALTAQPLAFSAGNVQSTIFGQTISESTYSATLIGNQWNNHDVLAFSTVAQPLFLYQFAAAEPAGENLPPALPGIFVLRQRAGFFGNNAPRWDSLPYGQRVGEAVDVPTSAPPNDPVTTKRVWKEGPYTENWDRSAGWPIWNRYPGDSSYGTPDVYLERVFNDIGQDSWVVFEAPGSTRYTPYRVADVSEASVTGFSISAKATGLELTKPDGTALAASDKTAALTIRSTIAHLQSAPLGLLELPIDDPLEEAANDGTPVGVEALMLDGFVPGLAIGQPLAITGEQLDADGITRSEIAIVKEIIHSAGYTILRFEARLQYRYVRTSVAINANVARATHGETVAEVLGSGDGAQANQRFVLKKPPLTYVSAANPRGVDSTLSVRVSGVLWEETPTLYGIGPRDERYTVRIDDDGKTRVTFGDGRSGARLPSGSENVIATYRSGIGPDGEVGAGSLMLLKTRPLGIRSVANPLPSGGAEAPEQLADARTNAPLTVLTLDRIVSLRDFEDFARGFPGVGKAQALTIWQGAAQIVHITAATASGDPIESVLDLQSNLVAAIDGARDPAQSARVAGFVPRSFNVRARLLIHPRLTFDDVAAAVTVALLDAFSFDTRGFGQQVTAAEVIATIQNVAGVVAVDLDLLDFAPDGAARQEVLPAASARRQGGEILKAELLLLNPAGIELEEMTP